MSQATLPNIIDLSPQTPTGVYEPNRGNFSVKLLVLHDTVGSIQYPDRNDLGVDASGYQSRENGTIRWFQGGGEVSIHYLVGPEATGAKVYRLCQEGWVAYHAGGTGNYPSSWHAPDGTFYQGQVNGVGIINWISIGIERWGGLTEAPGPNQTNAMLGLATDIARRYQLTPDQIVSHKQLEGDRQDGVVLLALIRTAVSQGQTPAVSPNPAQNPPSDPNQKSPSELISVGLSKLIDFLTPKGSPNAPSGFPAGIGENPDPNQNSPLPPIYIGGTLSQGVSGVVPYLGAGVVKNNGSIVHEKPFAEAQVVNTLNQGTALRLSAYTDKGSNNGSGTRWYLIDAADGGGWIYGGALN